MMSKKKFPIPHVGLRSFKTALSTTLCAVIYVLFDRNATFACIGAVFGMGSEEEQLWKNGANRLIGTIIGGFLGMGFFYLQSFMPGKTVEIILLMVGIIALIKISQWVRFPGAIQAGAVVFYIVMLNTPEHQYVSYALNRMLDTAVGVGMSVAINGLLTRQRLSLYFKNLTD